MSQEEEISRKEKRALRDAERHKRGKKRQHLEADEPGEEQSIKRTDSNAPEDVAEQQHTTHRATKTPRKRKASDDKDGDTAADHATPTPIDTPQPKKRKTTSDDTTGDPESTTDARQKASKSRFIVFVGNLPYKSTDQSLRTHFQKLEPFVLRHRTDPKTKQSKGFAFLEFENYDRMKTCLKLYHHSMFDPANPGAGAGIVQENTTHEEKGSGRRGKKSTARRINVELTAGGGGKTEGRKEKIRAKNVKLEEERKRRVEAERKEKARKDKKEGGKVKKKDEAEQDASVGTEEAASHGIHPSRLARVDV